MVDALGSALALGCSYIVVHDPAVIRWSVPRAQLWLCTLEACQELGQRGAVRLALENPGRYHDADIHNILAQPATLASFARRHDLDITLDTCHAGTAAMGLCEAYRLLRERTVNVHLSDLKRSRPVIDSHLFDNLFIHHQLPGEGFLPLAALVSELARDGFQGPITIETGLVALKGWSNVQCRLQLARILGYVRSAAARSSASTQQEPCSAP
jgi:sugar phosphate isomerase/epimerase